MQDIFKTETDGPLPTLQQVLAKKLSKPCLSCMQSLSVYTHSTLSIGGTLGGTQMHIMIGCWCLLMITIASLMMIEGGGGGGVGGL